jgi:predicted metal-dependent hydrolase
MRNEEIVLGTLRISLVRKRMKNVHLTVHPPEGRVTLVAPTNTRAEVARAYAISKLAWIRQQQTALNAQARETPRQFRERESHELWGRRQLMTVREADVKPFVKHDHRCITLTVRPGHDLAKRAQVMHECTRRCCMA